MSSMFQDLRKQLQEERSGQQEKLKLRLEQQQKLKDEVLALRDKIRDLEEKKKKVTEELRAEKAQSEQEIEEARRKLTKEQNALKKSDLKASSMKKKMKKIKEKFDFNKQVYENVLAEDNAYSEWTEQHGLKICSAPSESTENSEETIFILSNINPQNPEERFHILFDYLWVESGEFCVKNVHPAFEEAVSVIEKANASKDLRQFLKDCRRLWCHRFETINDNNA